jgi:hypothetical protein
MCFGSRFAWVLMAVVCVLTIVLFPAPVRHGPFTTVYGPTTDLRSSIDVHQVFPLMLSGAVIARVMAPLPASHSERMEKPFAPTCSPISPHRMTILRC